MSKKPVDKRKPVTRVVQDIMDFAKAGRADGPSSGLYGRDAQMSSALTRAGTLLASMDHAAGPARRGNPLYALLGTAAAPKPKKRSWLFAKASPMPDARRIEQLLYAVEKDAARLVLEAHLPDNPEASNRDINCVLPDGAVDPVCEPR